MNPVFWVWREAGSSSWRQVRQLALTPPASKVAALALTTSLLVLSLFGLDICFGLDISFERDPWLAKWPASSAEAATLIWDYSEVRGPERWSRLDPAFSTCEAGQAQSPIDFVLQSNHGSDKAQPAHSLRFDYRPSLLRGVNNGNTVRFEVEAGSQLQIEEQTYQLLQFHFHWPSEHQFTGQPREMEAHLVHRSSAGDLAVVAVILQAAATNPDIARLWQQMPMREGQRVVQDSAFNPAALLPNNSQSFLEYEGSLTTPPCSEGVRWIVLKQPVGLSPAQVQQFARAIGQRNARPVQPLRARSLLEFP